MKKKYLITGGAGFIGSNLTKYLVQRGHQIIVVDNLCAGQKSSLPNGVEFYQQDVRDTDALISLLEEVVGLVHLAALPSVQYSIENPVDAHDVNVNGTLSVLEAARKARVSNVVFASSSAVYGDNTDGAVIEDMALHPGTPYALHKVIGEQYMKLYSQLYDLQTTSLRFFNVYGPGMNAEGAYAAVIGRFLQQAHQKQPLTIVGDGSQTRDFVHVKDVSRGIELALKTKNVGEAINLGSGVKTSIKSLAKMIHSEFTHLPERIEVKDSCADINKAKKLLGWSPDIDLATGIEDIRS